MQQDQQQQSAQVTSVTCACVCWEVLNTHTHNCFTALIWLPDLPRLCVAAWRLLSWSRLSRQSWECIFTVWSHHSLGTDILVLKVNWVRSWSCTYCLLLQSIETLHWTNWTNRPLVWCYNGNKIVLNDRTTHSVKCTAVLSCIRVYWVLTRSLQPIRCSAMMCHVDYFR